MFSVLMVIPMSDSITLPREQFELLKRKAELFDHYVETEECSAEELQRIHDALNGPFLSEAEFRKRNPNLA